MLYLAIDFGEKRTGLAVGDDQTQIVTPAGTIEASKVEHLLKLIVQAVKEHHPDALVLGLPLNMDATEGKPAKKARQMAKQIQQATGLVVHLVDERQTSLQADQKMSQTGLTHRAKKARRDALAAAAILQRFLLER